MVNAMARSWIGLNAANNVILGIMMALYFMSEYWLQLIICFLAFGINLWPVYQLRVMLERQLAVGDLKLEVPKGRWD